MRDPLLPVLARGGVVGSGHHFEIARAVGVGADDPASAEVVGAVFHVALARGEYLKFAGILRIGIAHFIGNGAAGLNQQIGLVAGAAQAEIETVVRFLIDHHIILAVRAENVLLHPLAE